MGRIFCAAAVAALVLGLALPLAAFADDGVIRHGIDPWVTKADGSTFRDFSKNPIPAGFFCNRSLPFTGRIAFHGVPVTTEIPDALGRTDTIVERLDDAKFNRLGVATTRVQVRALQFEAAAPLETACGAYKVTVHLDGEQPTTRMKIFRENENGGRFLAPISVNIKMTFTPVSGRGGERSLTQQIQFPPDPRATWSANWFHNAPEHAAALRVDTDGDQILDTLLPGTSNFAAGWPALDKRARDKYISDTCFTDSVVCHEVDDCGHCTGGC